MTPRVTAWVCFVYIDVLEHGRNPCILGEAKTQAPFPILVQETHLLLPEYHLNCYLCVDIIVLM